MTTGRSLVVFFLVQIMFYVACLKAYLEHQLKAFNGSVSRVSERVGIERTHLYRKLRSLGIDPKQIKEASKE